MTHADLQELWDTILVQTWRRFGTIHDALDAWEDQTGQKLWGPEPRLLRIPSKGTPWKIGMRVFAAQHLPKISDRLWAQPPERDAALIAKLQTSSYDTLRNALRADDTRDLQNASRAIGIAHDRLVADRVLTQFRLKDGDGTTVKARVPRRRLR